ncbi:hypothetical protein ACTNCH_03920 [Candidatus Merdisoma sp. HCP28S3_D10]|uniref:hypothetical protein n=1 Tax=unclassified Candidatus Merdisoma TaxID=3099611 RepID=UPI003F8886B5
MSKIWDGMQPAIKEETKHVMLYTVVGLVLMWLAFLVLHLCMPEKVSFDYRVILGGLGGGTVAVLNFLWMGLMVQKAAAKAGDQDAVRTLVKGSYSQRMLFQMLWIIIAIAAPCFHYAAGIIPLLFPGTGIKIAGILKK